MRDGPGLSLLRVVGDLPELLGEVFLYVVVIPVILPHIHVRVVFLSPRPVYNKRQQLGENLIICFSFYFCTPNIFSASIFALQTFVLASIFALQTFVSASIFPNIFSDSISALQTFVSAYFPTPNICFSFYLCTPNICFSFYFCTPNICLKFYFRTPKHLF